MKHLLLVVSFLAFAAGCDTMYDEINSHLPELSVGDGVLGLNGEAGAEMTGGFTEEAGKDGSVSARATFTLERTFPDESPTNFKVTEISTEIGIALSNGIGLTVSKQGGSLPETIMMRGFRFDGTVSDAASTFEFPGIDVQYNGGQGGDFGFLRADCTTSGDSITCGYRACIFLGPGPNCYGINTTNTAILADRVRIMSMTGRPAASTAEQATERLLQVVTTQGTASTENTGRFTFSFPTEANSELVGATATIRIAEVNTQVKTNIL